MLVVDQLEELFTLCEDERERRDFLAALAALSRAESEDGPAAVVVLGLRSDFYTPCADHPWLRAALETGQILVGPMSEAQVREAILFPARDVGLRAEAGLAELLLRDLGLPGGYQAGRLPLLAHALRATWQQRHGQTLTVAGYRATGGIHHAVSATAERLYTGLDAAGQRAARALFLRLARIGDDADDTRRRMPRAELLEASGPSSAEVTAVIDAFTRGRLLTHHQDTVEITHEALLHAWPRLRQWIDADRAGHLLHQDLEQDAAAWDRDGRDSGRLYRGSRLENARTWAARAEETPLVAAFLLTISAQCAHDVLAHVAQHDQAHEVDSVRHLHADDLH
ncbi:hypothetical protein Aph01nite_22180 [Acrocarpospora phusangensis]|uniref:Novel STAND NTPase 1 domain-containing protein n=1 Tax=Acrocarpospora phusangensis TaxID=1070424 RepID=A0A919QAP0_9ACTN|nr:hypothetical protein [Acrocarpospora phusangensis]GIH23908.1 hypothetical protein Aph01nite_22180 [Acrocarpospora phusangensis]